MKNSETKRRSQESEIMAVFDLFLKSGDVTESRLKIVKSLSRKITHYIDLSLGGIGEIELMNTF